MSKIAIISDLHFGVRNSSSYFLDYQKSFFNDLFIPYIKKEKPAFVFILGDVFENRKQLNVNTLNVAKNIMREITEVAPTYCLIGNHDVFYKNTNKINSIEPILGDIPNFHIVSKPMELNHGLWTLGLISWINSENSEEYLTWLNHTNADVIFGHFEINSFDMIKGIQCLHGLEANIFERFDRVFSGHFHTRSSNGKITYVGNPYQTSWAEVDTIHGFHMYDPQKDDLVFIPNPNERFLVIHYQENLTEDELNGFVSISENKIVKVKVPLVQIVDKTKIDKFLDAVSNKSYNFSMIDISDVSYNTERANLIAGSDDYHKVMEMFIKDITPESSLDNVTRYMSKIYKEANELIIEMS